MKIYNGVYLRNLSRGKSTFMSSQILNESKKTHTSFDIFLSHSYLDKEIIEGIYIELLNLGYSVYVDWIIDPKLDRSNVTKESASLIRRRLQSSKTLLLAISTNASISKWMPWELGYVDGNTNKCAILPISLGEHAPTSYTGVEYLKLYPFVKKVPTLGAGEKLFVIEKEFEYVIFDNWLKNVMPVQQATSIFV